MGSSILKLDSLSQVLESVGWDKLAERQVVSNCNRSLILPATRAPAHQPSSASIGGPALVAVGTLGARFNHQRSRDVCTSLSHPTAGLRLRLAALSVGHSADFRNFGHHAVKPSVAATQRLPFPTNSVASLLAEPILTATRHLAFRLNGVSPAGLFA